MGTLFTKTSSDSYGVGTQSSGTSSTLSFRILSTLVIVISEFNEGRVGRTGEVTCWLNVDRLIVERELRWLHQIGVDSVPSLAAS